MENRVEMIVSAKIEECACSALFYTWTRSTFLLPVQHTPRATFRSDRFCIELAVPAASAAV
jgi:hypothetical protein